MSRDKDYPGEADCRQLLRQYQVPNNIIQHSVAVKQAAIELAGKLQDNGVDVDRRLVTSSALLHDIAKHICLNQEEDERHPEKGAEILRKEGYDQIAEVVAKHGLEAILSSSLDSWEEKIVYYVDKRVEEEKVIGLEQRLDCLRQRYPDSLELINRAEPLIKELEESLVDEVGCSDADKLIANETNK